MILAILFPQHTLIALYSLEYMRRRARRRLDGLSNHPSGLHESLTCAKPSEYVESRGPFSFKDR